MFTSAYRSLRPAEKAFVDGYVARLEREAERNHERISNALYRPVAQSVLDADHQGMLARPMVGAAITERVNQLAADSELSVARIVKELSSIAFANLGDMLRPDDVDISGTGTNWTPEQWAAVRKFKIKENAFGKREMEVELHAKQPSLDALAKFIGMLEADNPHWRAMSAKPINAATLPAAASVEDAGDAYARLLSGDVS